jgi:hypothetical protein
MVSEIRQIAINVNDLRAAESYYQQLFNMDLLGRETVLEDGLWYTLPLVKSWEDAQSSGIELRMVALKRGALVLVLFPGNPHSDQLYIVGLNMDLSEIAEVRERMPQDADVVEDYPDSLSFRDRYAIIWQIYPTGTSFHTNGEAHGRWLEL